MTHSPSPPKATEAEELPPPLLSSLLSPSLCFLGDSPSIVSSEPQNLRAGRKSKEHRASLLILEMENPRPREVR